MQSLEPEVRTAINSIYAELVATGATGRTPEPPLGLVRIRRDAKPITEFSPRVR
jgi:hypothetical protein